MKPIGANVASQAIKLATGPEISYSDMDCKAFVEQCVRDCGGSLNASGSNDMVRNHCAWLGTLDNAIAEGKLVKGAGLLIHEDTEDNLPAKYQGDGLGDFSHVGLYVGKDALYDTDKNGKKRLCDAVHSSATMKRVAGTTTKNGWTHVMLFDCIDYGMDVSGLSLGMEAENVLNNEPAQSGSVISNEGQTVQAAQQVYAIVISGDGGDVKVREKPEKGAIWKYAAPVGTRLLVLGDKNGYFKVMYRGKARWIDKRFTKVEA